VIEKDAGRIWYDFIEKPSYTTEHEALLSCTLIPTANHALFAHPDRCKFNTANNPIKPNMAGFTLSTESDRKTVAVSLFCQPFYVIDLAIDGFTVGFHVECPRRSTP
jgi:hypothetical protein